MEVMIFFLAGVLEDVMAASYNKCVQNNRPLTAGTMAVGITVFSVLVLQNLLFDFSLFSGKLWGFALGNLVGTYGVVRYWPK